MDFRSRTNLDKDMQFGIADAIAEIIQKEAQTFFEEREMIIRVAVWQRNISEK